MARMNDRVIRDNLKLLRERLSDQPDLLKAIEAQAGAAEVPKPTGADASPVTPPRNRRLRQP